MQEKKLLFRYEGRRLAGRTNRVDSQLSQALRAAFIAPSGAGSVTFTADGKENYVFELTRLEAADDPLVLVRVYEGFAAPDVSGATELDVPDRPLYPVHRRLSADGRHGPTVVKARAPPPDLGRLRALEAFVRLGSLDAAADELKVSPKTIRRRIRALEAATGRALLNPVRRKLRLTPAARQVSRALTTAFDLLEAAARPLPPGKRRGRPPPLSSPSARAEGDG